MNTQKAGVTLLELIVVIVIVGILAVISLPKFTAMKENSFDQEAIANLKIIQDAEKYYKMETGSYVSCLDVTAINTNLKLLLPSSENWNYKVEVVSGAFTAKAQRIGSDSRVKCIQETNDDPYTCTW